MEGQGIACIVVEVEQFLGGVDAEDALGVDDELTSQTTMTDTSLGHDVDLRLNLHQTEGHHEMNAGSVVHFRVVIVGLHVEDLIEVDSVEFVVSTQAEAVVMLHRYDLCLLLLAKVR